MNGISLLKIFQVNGLRSESTKYMILLHVGVVEGALEQRG